MPARQKKEEEISWFEKHELSIAIVCLLFIVALALAILFPTYQKPSLKTCGDGSFYNSCSVVKPYYCDGNGNLYEKASVCGCNPEDAINGDSCINYAQTQPKTVQLDYILNGQQKDINFTVYQGMSDNLSKISQVLAYSGNQKPMVSDFIFNKINQEDQAEFLMPLVISIQNLTKNKVDQARIAISIVQNIPYGASNKTSNFFGTQVNYSRYPYQVLYDDEGICGEKSQLLAFMLRGLGYGTSIFYYPQENHEAVGIECPTQNSYNKTGYCFVETTGPAIISDNSIQYAGGITLTSQPQITLVSTGIALPSGLPEYSDAQTLKSIREGVFMFFANSKFEKLKEKYGLIENYQIA